MGGCVIPAKPKYSTLKQVQIKEGSTVNPMSTSALRYVNNNHGSLLVPNPAIDPTNSQVRGFGIQRPYSPGSSILKPTTPPIGLDGRPSVQSVLPMGSVGSLPPQTQRITTIQSNNPMLGPNPSVIRQVELGPNNVIGQRYPNVPPAEPFSINPTSVPMMNPNQTTIQTVERTSANIPLPGPPQPFPSQYEHRQVTTVRQDSRPGTPGLAHPPMMPTVINKTIEEINITQTNPSLVPINSSGNSLPSIPSNMPHNFQSGIPPNIPSNIRPGTPPIHAGPPISSPGMTPTTSQYVPANNANPPFPVPPPHLSEQIRQTVLSMNGNNISALPRIVSPPPRPVTPLQPALNFDRRLLNFDRAMFSTDSKTPQLNSFTYNLDLPISGENKIRLL